MYIGDGRVQSEVNPVGSKPLFAVVLTGLGKPVCEDVRIAVHHRNALLWIRSRNLASQLNTNSPRSDYQYRVCSEQSLILSAPRCRSLLQRPFHRGLDVP
eukprot:scaffold2261_cov405-Prasinococcus_capsulatus_cf.AAC.19